MQRFSTAQVLGGLRGDDGDDCGGGVGESRGPLRPLRGHLPLKGEDIAVLAVLPLAGGGAGEAGGGGPTLGGPGTQSPPPRRGRCRRSRRRGPTRAWHSRRRWTTKPLSRGRWCAPHHESRHTCESPSSCGSKPARSHALGGAPQATVRPPSLSPTGAHRAVLCRLLLPPGTAGGRGRRSAACFEPRGRRHPRPIPARCAGARGAAVLDGTGAGRPAGDDGDDCGGGVGESKGPHRPLRGHLPLKGEDIAVLTVLPLAGGGAGEAGGGGPGMRINTRRSHPPASPHPPHRTSSCHDTTTPRCRCPPHSGSPGPG